MTLYRNIGGTAVATTRHRNIGGTAVATYELINGQTVTSSDLYTNTYTYGYAAAGSGQSDTYSDTYADTYGITANPNTSGTGTVTFAGNATTTVKHAVTASNTVSFTGSATTTAITAAPANTVLPTVAGFTQVGRTLTTTAGTWTNTPTSYTQQWNRTVTNSTTPAIVQSGSALSTTATTVVVSLTGVVAGHLLILEETEYNEIAITSVTGGGTWAKAISGSSATAAGLLEVWYCLNATGGSATVTVTLAAAPTANHSVCVVNEWNLTGATFAAGATSTTGTGATVTSPTYTPSVVGDLVIAMGSGAGSFGTPPTGWTAVLSHGSTYFDPGYNASAAAYTTNTAVYATETSSWTATSGAYSSIIAAFQQAPVTSAISGATGTSYTLATADANCEITCTVTATNGAGSNTATATATAPALPANLIANTGIANTSSTSNFSARVITASLSVDTTKTWSVDTLKITVTDAAAGYIVPTPITGGAPVTAGTHYTATLQAMAAAANSGIKTGSVSILWYQSDGATLISTSTPAAVTLNTSGPTTLTEGATAPTNAAYALPQFTAGTTSVAGDVVWLGNLSIIAA